MSAFSPELSNRQLVPADCLRVVFGSRTIEYLGMDQSESTTAQTIVGIVEAEYPMRNFVSTMEQNNDIYTRDHSRRVALTSVALGNRLRLPSSELFLLAEMGLGHDVGKEIPAIQEVVHSKMRFEYGTPERQQAMQTLQQHPATSAEMIRNCTAWSIEKRRKIASGAGAHHMYSEGAYGDAPDDDVAHLAPVVAVADMLDALASARPYKKAFSVDKTAEILESQFTGSKLIVRACFESIPADDITRTQLAAIN